MSKLSTAPPATLRKPWGLANVTSRTGPAFVLFLLVNATLFLRPAELLPALAAMPIYEVLILGACIFSIEPIKRQLTVNALRRQPISLCVAGLFVAILLSHLSHMYLYGTKESGIDFIKTMIYYVLLLAVIDTPAKLKTFLKTVAVCASSMVLLCILDYTEIYDLQSIDHIKNRTGFDATGDVVLVARMRGMGIFQDPNDISLVIVAAGVLCGYFFTDPAKPSQRPLWLALLVVLAVGLYFTRSRGGLLAAGGAFFVYSWIRYGRKTACAVAFIGICLLPFAAGRQTTIDLSSGTGHQRLLLWREGLAAIKSANLIFGIGAGLYGDIAGLVAHNSFIHAYVETGIVGGTFFLGCFFLPALAIYRSHYLQIRHAELARFKPFLGAILGGWCTGMLSLSRCYVVPTYLVVGTAAAYLNLTSFCVYPRRMLLYADKRLLTKLCGSSCFMFVSIYVFVTLFAR